MRDFSDDLAELRRRVEGARAYLQDRRGAEPGSPSSRTRSASPTSGTTRTRARKVTTELAQLQEDVELVDAARRHASPTSRRCAELAREEGDDVGRAARSTPGSRRSARELDTLELRALFTGEHDERDAICTVNSGAGGTDAQDWTNMLLRMYLRWAERRGFAVEIDEVSPGTEAGISSATFTVKGRYAYGLLAGEHGVHRLIRISPFDANARRQTAFASFDAVPALDEAEAPEIDAERPAHRHVPVVGRRRPARERHRLRGPHHPPADRHRRVVPERALADAEQGAARCRSSRRASPSGSARSATPSWTRCRARSATSPSAARSARTRCSPYQLVKDERTRYETGNVQAVLDGDSTGSSRRTSSGAAASRPTVSAR